MNNENELTVGQSLVLHEGIKITRKGMLFNDDVETRDVIETAKRLDLADSLIRWSRGDIHNELNTRSNGQWAKQFDQLEFGWDITAVSQDAAVNFLMPYEWRREELAFEYHKELVFEFRKEITKEIADEWLTKCINNEWSVKQFRSALRQRIAIKTGGDMIDLGITWLVGVRNAVAELTKHDVEAMSESEKDSIRETIEPVIDIWNAINE